MRRKRTEGRSSSPLLNEINRLISSVLFGTDNYTNTKRWYTNSRSQLNVLRTAVTLEKHSIYKYKNQNETHRK